MWRAARAEVVLRMNFDPGRATPPVRGREERGIMLRLEADASTPGEWRGGKGIGILRTGAHGADSTARGGGAGNRRGVALMRGRRSTHADAGAAGDELPAIALEIDR